MDTSIDTTGKTNKFFPWAAGFFLLVCIVYGFSGSNFAGFLAVIAFLISLPPVIRIIVNKQPKLQLLNNQYVKWSVVSVLTIANIFFVSAAEKTKIIDEYNKNKTQILEEVASLRKEKKFFDAKYKLDKYAEAIKTDQELVELHKVVGDEYSQQLDREVKARQLEDRKVQAKADAIKRAPVDTENVGSTTVSQAISVKPKSDGRDCRVSSISNIRSDAFVCSGSGDACLMDEQTIVVINGAILPAHANNTAKIKVGFRCNCLSNRNRLYHDKIDCVG